MDLRAARGRCDAHGGCDARDARIGIGSGPCGPQCTGKSTQAQGGIMKKVSLLVVSIAMFAAGVAVADRVHDWHDLDKVHDHIVEAIHEMERARAANHYDMAGHGAKAEALLRDAEREVHMAVEAARAAP